MMNQIRKYTAKAWVVIGLLSAAGCSQEDPSLHPAPEGTVQVNFCQSGTYGAPLSDLKSSALRVEYADIPIDPDPDGTLHPYQPTPVPDGTTLWVAIYEVKDEALDAPSFITVKSYRVSGRSMIPCKVDKDGNPESDYDTPLYLPAGKYIFRALGPARELARQTASGELSLYLDNGDWIIANDSRYKETSGMTTVTELKENNMDQLVELDPLINQTARLKFTIYSDNSDPFVHTLKMMPIGVELSGLQNRYSKGSEDSAPWNWTLCTPADTLVAHPGNKNTLVYLKKPLVSTDNRIALETHILPTDAVATPLIVLFNIEVNGNPTQFEMMLNRKMFRAGYSYHYRGKVTINQGVAALVWESVSWDAEIPFFPANNRTVK